jgi:hypothetical protein
MKEFGQLVLGYNISLLVIPVPISDIAGFVGLILGIVTNLEAIVKIGVNIRNIIKRKNKDVPSTDINNHDAREQNEKEETPPQA